MLRPPGLPPMGSRWAPLAMLAVSMLVAFVAAPLMFLGWALALVALAWLSRDEDARRPARLSMGLLLAIVLVALPVSGLSIGWRGRPLASLGGMGEGVLAGLAAIAAPTAAALFLALAPGPARPRALARGAIGTFAAALLIVGVVAVTGEKIQGLAGLLGAATIALVLAAMALALWGEVRTPGRASSA